MLTISTGVAAAPVDFLLAVGAHVTSRAAAGVSTGSLLHAGSSTEAGSVGAGHSDDFTVLPVEALRACAGVIIHQILRRKTKAVSINIQAPWWTRLERSVTIGCLHCNCLRSCTGCCRTRWSRSRRFYRWSRACRCRCSCPDQCWYRWRHLCRACDWCRSSDPHCRTGLPSLPCKCTERAGCRCHAGTPDIAGTRHRVARATRGGTYTHRGPHNNRAPRYSQTSRWLFKKERERKGDIRMTGHHKTTPLLEAQAHQVFVKY